MRVLVYDIELKREPTDKLEWAAARQGELGISIMCIYDRLFRRPYFYDENTVVEAVEHMNTAELLVSFNGLGFDTPCIQAISGKVITAPQYDIFAEMKEALKGKAGHRNGYSLDDVARRTLGYGKNQCPELEPTLYAQGRYAELVNNNLDDVLLTSELFNHICAVGHVVGVDHESVVLPAPFGAHNG